MPIRKLNISEIVPFDVRSGKKLQWESEIRLEGLRNTSHPSTIYDAAKACYRDVPRYYKLERP